MTDAAQPPESPTEVAPAPTAGTDDAMRTRRIDTLAAYLRRHQGSYSRDALRRSAEAAGYETRDIDAAIAVAGEAPPPSGMRAARPVLGAIAFVIVIYVVVFIAALVPDLSQSALLVLGGILLGGIAGSIILRATRPQLARALGLGVVLAVVIPLVIGLVVAGVCIVAFLVPARSA